MTLLRQLSVHPLYQTEEKHFMTRSTEDEATGELHEVKAAINENVGEITHDPDLEVVAKRKRTRAKLKTA